MQVWEKLSLEEILQTLEMELAKAKSELHCAEGDIQKIKNRIAFILTAVHHLKKV
jgi:hypothetical protein